MTLTFPRDLRLRLYLGRWVEVTDLAEGRSLRQSDPVAVQWAAQSEQLGKVPPSTVEGVLNNTGGHWTPDNPMSDYWAYLRARNVPSELALRASRDTFGRTLASTWGTSDTGDTWTLTGGTFAVGSGVGTHTVSAANSFQVAYLGDDYGDCQVAATASWNLNVAGGAIEPLNLVLRYQTSGTFSGEHYLLRVSVSAAEVLTVAIFHSSLGALTSAVTVATLTPGANSYRAKFQVEGQSLRGKVYAAGPSNDVDQNEPLGWQVSAHHERLTSGRPGIRTGVASGNTNVPVTISYDDWDLRLLRHCGELAKLQPTWDESHRIKKAKFKAADITQRLGRPERPALSTAPRRYLASNAEFTTTDHWPLDESATAPAQGLNTVGSGRAATFQRETGVVPNRGAITWGGTDNVLTCVPGFVALNNGGRLAFTVDQTALGTSWSVMWAMRLTPDAGAQVFLSTAAVSNRFLITFYTDGTYELFTNPSGASLATGTVAPGGLAGNWVTFGITTFNNGGAAVGFHLNVDGNTLGIGSTTGDGAHSPLSQVLVHVPQPSTGGQGDGCFSNLFVTSTRFDTLIGGTTTSIGSRASNVLKGWPGETAGLRAFRLCAEESVPFDYWGDLSLTRQMGPQRPIPLLDQLQECADTDQGVLYAPRYTPGVALRPRLTMCAQTAGATISYSGGQVAPEFAPSADDRFTANLVRAERINGGYFVLEQTSGPMNTRDPGTDPDAVGRSPAEVKVNVQSDALLPDVAGWLRALGTVPELRFPRVTVNLRAPELNDAAGLAVARALLNLHPGDRLLVTGMSAADVYRDLDQLVRGGRETYGNVRRHSLSFNTAPYERYRTGVADDSAVRADSDDSSLNTATASGSPATLSVKFTTVAWTTDATQFPFDVMVGGQRMTISAISGTTSPQTFTVSSASVNGVARTWPADTKVSLAVPSYFG